MNRRPFYFPSPILINFKNPIDSCQNQFSILFSTLEKFVGKRNDLSKGESDMKQWRILIYSVLLFFLSTTSLYGQRVDIRILHLNEFHGVAESYKPLGSDELLGGIPYPAAKIHELRKEKPTLSLSAGDMIQGNNSSLP